MPGDYISRSELLKRLESDDSLKHARKLIRLYVEEAPTAPVETVVHCSNCQYRNTVECPSYRKLVDTGKIITPTYMRFCSYGEKKDGAPDA